MGFGVRWPWVLMGCGWVRVVVVVAGVRCGGGCGCRREVSAWARWWLWVVDFVVVVAPVVAVPPVLANRVVDLGFVIGLLGLPFWPGAVRVVAVGSKK
uniref:Uncharacterized protein n=1 Tax=Fagus sylvatica TaxID=28930 RepID=A0A2N9GYE2_FAGSY